MGFYPPGSGIIHQVVLENYAFPGGLMIGTDSHTPNAGGLGMMAVGVGGADAVDVMVGLPWELCWPKLIGIKLVGKLSGWTQGKDVILKLLGMLTVKGGTGRIVEYFGPGAETLSATAKATITNMGAEIGATNSIFGYDQKIADYLRATDRADLADLADQYKNELCADPEVYQDPEKYYDQVIEINLSELEPHLVGPHTPDLAHPISKMLSDAKANNYPLNIGAVLIGSCTNSSYEDLGRAANLARQAKKLGLKSKVPLLISPGSEQVRATVERDGYLDDLKSIGAVILANACGPCIGQWERTDMQDGLPNCLITTFNRNFPRRNDGFKSTLAFIGSPEIAVAYALTGTFEINPLELKLEPPVADELPKKGFTAGKIYYVAPAEDGSRTELKVSPTSERLSLLTPFSAFDPALFQDLPVLLKAVGKCTTDHISPAGPWLRYRGHLDKISDNAFLGAKNTFTEENGTGVNVFTGNRGEKLSAIARDYKQRGLNWVVIGDENYGEGSSREHAAMSPRYLGCLVVLVRSFARIHETNLKKQGILALTFANSADYERIKEDDRLSFPDVAAIASGETLKVEILHSDGEKEVVKAKHSYGADQITWLKAGSALNLIAALNTKALPSSPLANRGQRF
jgi:aconitate hydratase